MDEACSAVCMLCERSPGYLVARKLVIAPGNTIRVQHRRLHCGRCNGSIVVEPDDSLTQPDWAVHTPREVAGVGALPKVARRRAT